MPRKYFISAKAVMQSSSSAAEDGVLVLVFVAAEAAEAAATAATAAAAVGLREARLNSAPHLSSNLAASRWRFLTASLRGVSPLRFSASTSAPF